MMAASPDKKLEAPLAASAAGGLEQGEPKPETDAEVTARATVALLAAKKKAGPQVPRGPKGGVLLLKAVKRNGLGTKPKVAKKPAARKAAEEVDEEVEEVVEEEAAPPEEVVKRPAASAPGQPKKKARGTVAKKPAAATEEKDEGVTLGEQEPTLPLETI